MKDYFLPPIFTSFIWSAFSLILAIPLIKAVHHVFHLENPPFNGLVLLSFGIVICFLGAAIIGMICGSFSERNPASMKALAAFLGLAWSLTMALWMFPTYAGMVVDDLTRQSAVIVFNERENLIPGTKSAIQAYQDGKMNDVTRENGRKILEHSGTLAVRGLSGLPAILMFGFALFGAPLVGFWECRRAQR